MDLKCERCGNQWITKTENKPKTCPSCKSPYWQKPLTPYWEKIRNDNKLKRAKG